MPIRSTPLFQPGQVDSYDPSQTVGQFAKGANDIVGLSRHMLDRATQKIAYEKLKNLAPLAQEQAKQELLNKTMQDTEAMSGRAQAARASKIEGDLYELGGRRAGDLDAAENDVNDAIMAGAGAPAPQPSIIVAPGAPNPSAPPVSTDSQPINNDVRAIVENTPSGQAPKPSLNEDLAALGRPTQDISASSMPNPQAPPISQAVREVAAPTRRRAAPVPLNDGFYYSREASEGRRQQLRGEKNTDAINKAIAEREATFRAGQYQVFVDPSGQQHQLKTGEPIPEGWKLLIKTGAPIQITNGKDISVVTDAASIPAGWHLYTPSVENANTRTTQDRIEALDKDTTNQNKIFKDYASSPAQKRMARDAIIRNNLKKQELNATLDKKGGAEESAAPAAAPSSERVKVRSPDGTLYTLPSSQLKQAQSKGYILEK